MRKILIIMIFLAACAQTGVETMTMKLTSPAFAHEGSIPRKYTCDSEDISPPLHIEGVPQGTKSMVLIMDDPDAPRGTWVHWIKFNIPPKTYDISAGKNIEGSDGLNSWGKTGYGGPCPPDREHRYFFKLYALDTQMLFEQAPTKEDLEEAMKSHILGQAELMGTYARG